MSSQETTPHVMRPPVLVILMTLLWSTAAAFEAIIWYLQGDLFYLVVTIVAVLVAVGVLKGYRWVYWFNICVCSIGLGIAILQIQIPQWAPRSTSGAVLFRAAATAGIICIHQLKSFQTWFHIERTKKHRVVFWLLVGMLTVMGLYLLPTIRSLRN